MDQNQTINNQNVDNDLQKAIDDIASSTSVDPVFSDPIAAPSSIPEGDDGELDEPIGPFPEPIAPLESMNIPEINDFISEQDNPTPAKLETEPMLESIPEPMPAPAPKPMQTAPRTMPSIAMSPKTPVDHSETYTQGFNASEIKRAALRDLTPVLNRININAAQKFRIYRDIFEELKDYTILESAYQSAREIPDEAARAEALLYLVEVIDQMQ